MIQLHVFRGERLKVALLSGDAGCSKSYAVSLSEKKLQSMDISVVVSAMTSKAMATLMDSCSLDQVYTFHKMMGFTRDLLDRKLSVQDFTLQYCTAYWNVIAHFDVLRESELPRELTTRHSCKEMRPESCAVCSKMFHGLRTPRNPQDNAPMEDVVPRGERYHYRRVWTDGR